jgi:hypothetical protein
MGIPPFEFPINWRSLIMVKPPEDPLVNDEHRRATAENGVSDVPGVTPARKSKSMHEGIAVWCDCCSCEAEPYWVAVAEEMGIDLGSDYELGTGSRSS